MDTTTRYENAERYDYTAHQSTESEARNRRAPAVAARRASVECGSGWYHDAAIKDAQDALAHPYR